MTTFLIIVAGVTLFNLGFVAGWLVFKNWFYKPMFKEAKKAQKLAREAIDIAALHLLVGKAEQPKTKDGMILSPIQIKRYGQE